MAYYGINELTHSGPTASLIQAGGFQRSTVFGTSSAHTHQFTGSVYVSGTLHANEYRVTTITTASGSTFFGNDPTDTHTFTGSVYAAGSVLANSTITADSLITTYGAFGNPTTLSASVTIPTNYNYALVGPVHFSGGISVIVSGSGNFKIL